MRCSLYTPSLVHLMPYTNVRIHLFLFVFVFAILEIVISSGFRAIFCERPYQVVAEYPAHSP